MRWWCWAILFLLGFDGAPVIGPEFESALTEILHDLPMFDGARIEGDRVHLLRGDTRVTLVHPSEGGAPCGPFGMLDGGGLMAEEQRTLCGRLEGVRDPFHRPTPGAAGAHDRWTYDRPPATTPGWFAGVGGALLMLALGALFFLGWVVRKQGE